MRAYPGENGPGQGGDVVYPNMGMYGVINLLKYLSRVNDTSPCWPEHSHHAGKQHVFIQDRLSIVRSD